MRVRRRTASVLLVALVATVMTAVFGQPAQAEGFYRIVNFGSGKCAEVNRFGNPGANGALIVQRTCDRQAVQQWTPVNLGGGVYEFVNRSSGLCMDVRNGVNADSTPIQQWACRGSASMRWTLNPDSFSGVHLVQSRTGGRCLDVRGGAVINGAQIQIYRCTGFANTAQVWSLMG